MSFATHFSDQTARIREKLGQARAVDAQLQAFGARRHGYVLGPPLQHADVAAFERGVGIELPPAYCAFLTQVGHGGTGSHPAAAGPFYGILPLKGSEAAFGSATAARLQPQMAPEQTEDGWKAAVDTLDDNLSDAEYDAAFAALLGGLLRLGHQGCESYHGLIVVGINAGRIVNFDTDLHKPAFAPDANFLDWYERWLDRVIDGTLMKANAAWFGYDAD